MSPTIKDTTNRLRNLNLHRRETFELRLFSNEVFKNCRNLRSHIDLSRAKCIFPQELQFSFLQLQLSNVATELKKT